MPAAPYDKPPAVRDPRTTRQLLKVIWFMLIATLLLVWFALRLIDPNESPRPHPEAIVPFAIAVSLSIVMVGLAMLCRQMLFKTAAGKTGHGVKPQRYLIGSLVGMALCEAPVLVSLMLGYLFDAQTLFGLAAGIGLLGLLMMYPSGKPMEPQPQGDGRP